MVDIVDFGHLVIDIWLQLIYFLFLKWIQSASSWKKRSLVKSNYSSSSCDDIGLHAT